MTAPAAERRVTRIRCNVPWRMGRIRLRTGNILLSVMRTVRLGLDRRLRLHAMTKGPTRVRRDGILFIVKYRELDWIGRAGERPVPSEDVQLLRDFEHQRSDARRVLPNADRSDEPVDCETLGGRNRTETEGFSSALKSLIGCYLDQQRICCGEFRSL